MSDTRARRAVRNRRLPEPLQRLEHGMRLSSAEVNGGSLPPVPDKRQWAPVGPSIVETTISRRDGRMMVSGRVRDVQVDRTGTRAYAGAAKGGVWYTGDGGLSWRPVGGWMRRIGEAGGPNSVLSVGALLVRFGENVSEDFVMVGTGEPRPTVTRTVHIRPGGVGVLAALGPATRALDEDPWEPTDGLAEMEGLGVWRLARKPGVTAGADGDIVVAATNAGLFRGTRAGGRFIWARVGATYRGDAGEAFEFRDADGHPAQPLVTDVLWLPREGDADGRLYACLISPYEEEGLVFVGPPTPAYSDDAGGSFRQVNGSVLGPESPRMQRPFGRASLASVGAGADVRVYVLGGWKGKKSFEPEICAVDHPLAAHDGPGPPTLRRLNDPPRTIRFWKDKENRFWSSQGNYDQAIEAVQVGDGAAARDRIYLGGSAFWAASQSQYLASLWCFQVDGDDLRPVPGISDRGGTNRSVLPGHVGTGVHVDIHAIRVAEGNPRRVWVGNDGGVTVSTESGRDNTFITRSDGLAALEGTYGASHPTSSSFAVFGCHDNGIIGRDGDVVWRELISGDGGGVAFDPARPHHVLGQLHNGLWLGSPTPWFETPDIWEEKDQPDNDNALFYSNASTAPMEPGSDTTRIAIGTDRVWVNDVRGRARKERWRVLPGWNFQSKSGVINRKGSPPRRSLRGGDLPERGPKYQVAFGILQVDEGYPPPFKARDGVSAVRWVRDSDGRASSLLVLIGENVFRFDQVGDPAEHKWQPSIVTMVSLDSGVNADGHGAYLVTEIAPVHGTDLVYVTTTGEEKGVIDTLYLWDPAVTQDGKTKPSLVATGLKDAIKQRDPAYSVTVDDETKDVYVGTALGVWRGVRRDGKFNWTITGRRLPPAIVQDLEVHRSSPDAPKTLVATLASRGLWQLNLEREDHEETWIRCHPHDDRRVFPTPLASPRRDAAEAPLPVDQSPDIVVRPRWPRTAAPPAYPGRPLTHRHHTRYQVWTFQTAFQRFAPSIEVDGQWTRPFELAIDRFREARADLSATRRPQIDEELWNLVVVDDPGAAYEPPWRPPLVGVPVAANEVDLRSVVPQQVQNGRWHVPAEQCTVEVLVHHRDTNPLGANEAFAMVLWQWGDPASVNCDGVAAFARSIDRDAGVPPASAEWIAPTAAEPHGRFRGWHVAANGSSVLHRLPVQLDARMPRAVPVDIDLSRNAGAANPDDVVGRVVVLALVGSSADPFSQDPPASGQPEAFVRGWRHAAMRTIVCTGPR